MTTNEPKMDYQFTNNWFEHSRKNWELFLPHLNPSTILEIGSYEGRSTCFLIDSLAAARSLEVHCIDTWEGGSEHQPGGVADGIDMEGVRSRFETNTQLAIRKATNHVDLVIHHGTSDTHLSRMLAFGKQGYFDLIYVDGSHQAPDVLCDAVLGFRLLRTGGVMVFDDYLWSEFSTQECDPLRCPKPAIDAFVNLHQRKLEILQLPLYQLYVKKISD